MTKEADDEGWVGRRGVVLKGVVWQSPIAKHPRRSSSWHADDHCDQTAAPTSTPPSLSTLGTLGTLGLEETGGSEDKSTDKSMSPTDRQTARQIDRQTDRQTNRLIDWRTDWLTTSQNNFSVICKSGAFFRKRRQRLEKLRWQIEKSIEMTFNGRSVGDIYKINYFNFPSQAE